MTSKRTSKRGRPSINELMTPRLITVYERQRPPPELAGEEAEAFLAFANAESADWFTPTSVPLLAQLARHIVQARRIAELIERTVGQRETELGYYVELLKQQRAESQIIAALATKLRLTPQSRRTDRGNARPLGEGRRPPWEMPDDNHG